MTVFDIFTEDLCDWGRILVQLCLDIKEHSSKVLTNTATLCVSASEVLENKKSIGLENKHVLHKHFTFCW